MFRLTREVRFAINAIPDAQLDAPPANSFGGYPALVGPGAYYTARVTLAGELDPVCQYLVNIKDVDLAVRDVLPQLQSLAARQPLQPVRVLQMLYDSLQKKWPHWLAKLELSLTPQLCLSLIPTEHPMMRVSQKFEFAAAHRLHNPAMSDEENRRLFGKCNNPLGHGHNYEVQVTVRTRAASDRLPIDVPALERLVDETVIRKFDHKHLNVEVPEFAQVIPSVENIAKVIYQLLKKTVESSADNLTLAAVTVWETPKTWCEYSE